ncbi:MAG: bL28 family ribosomal protein [Patescibacteria group bacterium]|nr:bL28 family ribosomal protein [Patescibacteria group bacterium]
MARVCDFCWKGTAVGRHIRHHVKTSQWKFKAPKKARKFKANVQSIRLNINGMLRSFRICTRCLRTISKDEQVKSAKTE